MLELKSGRWPESARSKLSPAEVQHFKVTRPSGGAMGLGEWS